jgi:hypothetical protein
MLTKFALAVFLPILGVLVLVWGMPRASRHLLPWRWRVGILMIGLGLIFWPLFYFFYGHEDLEMVWLPIWMATIATFVVGIVRLIWADIWGPSPSGVKGNWGNDFGWVMRPRPEPRTGMELFQQNMEDRANPWAGGLRRIFEWSKAPQQVGSSSYVTYVLIFVGFLWLVLPPLFLVFSGALKDPRRLPSSGTLTALFALYVALGAAWILPLTIRLRPSKR